MTLFYRKKNADNTKQKVKTVMKYSKMYQQ